MSLVCRRGPPQAPHEEPPNTSIFVRQLPPEATPEQIEQAFAQYGPVKGGQRGVSIKGAKGRDVFAFVEFEAQAGMQGALQGTTEMEGQRVRGSSHNTEITPGSVNQAPECSSISAPGPLWKGGGMPGDPRCGSAGEAAAAVSRVGPAMRAPRHPLQAAGAGPWQLRGMPAVGEHRWGAASLGCRRWRKAPTPPAACKRPGFGACRGEGGPGSMRWI